MFITGTGIQKGICGSDVKKSLLPSFTTSAWSPLVGTASRIVRLTAAACGRLIGRGVHGYRLLRYASVG